MITPPVLLPGLAARRRAAASRLRPLRSGRDRDMSKRGANPECGGPRPAKLDPGQRLARRPTRDVVTGVTLPARPDGRSPRRNRRGSGGAKEKGPRLATRPRYQAVCRVVSGCRFGLWFRLLLGDGQVVDPDDEGMSYIRTAAGAVRSDPGGAILRLFVPMSSPPMSDTARRVYSARRFRIVVLLLTLVFLPDRDRRLAAHLPVPALRACWSSSGSPARRGGCRRGSTPGRSCCGRASSSPRTTS